MSDSKPKNKENKNYAVKKVIDIVLALALVGGTIYGINAVTSDFADINRKQTDSGSSVISSESDIPDGGSVIYVTEMADNEDIYNGSLIVVNGETEYKGSAGNLVSMYDVRSTDGTEDYLVMSSDVSLKIDAAKALNEMVKAFVAETGHKDIIVDGGYRSVEYQQELYDSAEDKSTAAKPGFSDYHTGYSIDLSIDAGDGAIEDFTGEGDYSWFEKNCYKYGYIVRFPDGKQESTGYEYRPWHFRYVGKAHAYYMTKNNLSLEEYVAKLKSYEYTKTHLTFTDDNGKEYETYYYPKDATASSTILAVPSTDYQVSGNNTDGFIIIFQTNSEEMASADATGATQQSESNTEAVVSETEAAENTENNEENNREVPEE